MTFSSPSAAVICDSVSHTGARLTTIEVTLHRFVLAELNTHRVFSRNSSSSRAIPVAKQIERVMTNPAVPMEFGANQKGMQASELVDDAEGAMAAWLAARDAAVEQVRTLQAIGVHKQITNRLLEPFMWQTVIVSSTEWQNFFAQRCSPLAQPEIRLAAEAMREAYDASTPAHVEDGGWHTPYIRAEEESLDIETKKRISVARCARVSYLTHDGKRDLDADLNLYDRLISAEPPHWSPMEHVATPGDGPGNFHGWKQLRHLLGGDRA
ncbi:FAD-dependent thymidylate synthase [Stomatohabitans albus]|uniref:FAD-dependent thymidylate synthase n=1 Tax=Stomatohabitans albus TaxID=3110766 RepID=UPI00300D1C9A